MITEIDTLAHSFKLGTVPTAIIGCDPRKLHRLGEQLDQTMRDAVDGIEALDELDRIREILEAFGALDPTDKTTGLADLIEALLPPAKGE